VQLWDVIGGQPILRDLKDALEDPNEKLVFHNRNFDRTILNRALGRIIPASRYRCTMEQAYSHGLPGSLEMLGIVLGVPPELQKRVGDKELIQLFCVPRADGRFNDRWSHPAEWAQFCEYAIWDVHSGRACYVRLPTYNYGGINLDTAHLSLLINERGFGFDVELAKAAMEVLAKAKTVHDRATDTLTAGAAQAATQRARLLAWFQRSGLDIPNMRASTIREYLEHDDLDPVVRGMLELRLEASKSSGAKYRRGLELVGALDRIRFSKQFAGAGKTGRYSGRGFQPDNMMRPVTYSTNLKLKPNGERATYPVKAAYIEQVIIPGILSGDALKCPILYGGPNEACANALRGAIIPDEGNELYVADWANIEGRVMAWIAGATELLALYGEEDSDTYMPLAARMFGIQLEVMLADKKSYDQHRQAAKVVTLACQYGGSVGALVTMAAGYNMDIDALGLLILKTADPKRLKKAQKAWWRAYLKGEDYGLDANTFIGCHVLVQSYREENAEVTQVRYDVDWATKAALKNPGTRYDVAKCGIWYTGTWLIIELPSGRRLMYNSPRLEVERVEDPETGKVDTREYLTYMTARGKTWRREKAWSGLFIENIVQAIANDVLRCGLLEVHADTLTVPAIRIYLEGLRSPETPEPTAVSGHVHDEINVDVPAGSYSHERLIDVITTQLLAKYPWMRGLPLEASGYTAVRYKK
jgi:DNA polymerase